MFATCREREIRPQIIYGSERADWILTMVAGGLGAYLIWESWAAAALRRRCDRSIGTMPPDHRAFS